MTPTWYAPSTLAEATHYLYDYPECNIIAGGTDLLVKYKERVTELPALMGLDWIEELREISHTTSTVRLGAMVTHSRIVNHPWLQENMPALCIAAASIGSRQIRNRGTVGGNLANASPAADLVPPLVVAKGVVEIAGKDGRRRMRLEDFFQGPGKTRLQLGEMIVAVEWPRPGPFQGSSFHKIGKRKAMSISTASAAAAINFDATGRITDIRLCLGSVGPVPILARRTAEVVCKGGLNSLAAAVAMLENEIQPISDMRGSAGYRRQAARKMLEQAVHEAWTLAKDKQS